MSEGTPPANPESSRLCAGLFRVREMSNDLIAVFDPALRHVYCNEGVCRFTRLLREQILGRGYDELPMSRHNAAQMQGFIAQVFATGKPKRLEVWGVNRETRMPTEGARVGRPDLARA